MVLKPCGQSWRELLVDVLHDQHNCREVSGQMRQSFRQSLWAAGRCAYGDDRNAGWVGRFRVSEPRGRRFAPESLADHEPGDSAQLLDQRLGSLETLAGPKDRCIHRIERAISHGLE